MAGDSKRLRLFLATPLDDAFLDSIARFLERYSAQFKTIKWVQARQVHLTLHFFGSIPEEKIQQICTIVSAETSRHAPFFIRLQDFGFFPPKGQLRVLWIGLGGNLAGFKALQRGIAEALGVADFPSEEREFSPHATVGRVKDKLSLAEQQKLAALSFPPTELKPLNRIHLFKSQLTPAGAEYDILETFPLSKSPAA